MPRSGPTPRIRAALDAVSDAASHDSLISALQRVLHLGSPWGLLALEPHVWSPVPEVAGAARRALAALLPRIAGRELLAIDRNYRLWRDRQLDPRGDLARWAKLSDAAMSSADEWPLMALSTFNSNGHIRLAAVNRLARAGDGRSIPYLLIRSVDWVADIRTHAVRALERMINRENIATVVEAHPLAIELAQRSRGSASPVLKWFERLLLAQPEGPVAIRAATWSVDRDVRLECFQRLETMGLTSPDELMRALGDRDRRVRAWAIACLEHRPPSPEVLGIARQILSSRHPEVRDTAVALLALDSGPDVVEPLRSALLDSNSTVRLRAATSLARRGSLDPLAFYREATTTLDGADLGPALLGLAWLGGEDDAAEMAVRLDHPSSLVRSAALGGFARLCPREAGRAAITALSDRSRRVSRQGRSLLSRIAGETEATALRRAVLDGDVHLAANALRSLGSLNKWRRLSILLAATQRPEPRLQVLTLRGLRAWLKYAPRCQPDLSSADCGSLRDSLELAAPHLPAGMKTELNGHLFLERAGFDYRPWPIRGR